MQQPPLNQPRPLQQGFLHQTGYLVESVLQNIAGGPLRISNEVAPFLLSMNLSSVYRKEFNIAPAVSPSQTLLRSETHKSNCFHQARAFPLRSGPILSLYLHGNRPDGKGSRPYRPPNRCRSSTTLSTRLNSSVLSPVQQLSFNMALRSYLISSTCRLRSPIRT